MASEAHASAARAADPMPEPRYTLDKPAVYSDPGFLGALKRCSSVLMAALNNAAGQVAAGVRPVELAEIVERELIRCGATPILKGLRIVGAPVFPAAAAVSVNEVAINGVPDEQLLKTGDVLTIDSACELDGAVCDAAVSVVVGGGASDLVTAARSVLAAALGAIAPGRPLSGIAQRAQAEAHRLGFELLDECIAHGTGLALHQPPAVWAGQTSPSEAEIVPGMVLAVEPVVVEQGAGRPRTEADGWSRVTRGWSAYEERTVFVGEKGPIELSPLAFGCW